jgi:tripartite ATP-independent transporter DctM subunit
LNWVDFLPLLMFVAMGVMLFTGLPVAAVLGGVALWFGVIGWAFDVFQPIEFFAIIGRVWGGVAENVVLTAVPMFILMGTILERSGIAEDLLNCLQILLRRVPAALAVAVVLMGTILAATTGIVGASVVMLSSLALPAMLRRGYSPELATGTIGASGTLGILIPPSIMLVFMADLMALSASTLFVGAMLPGLVLAGLYLVYVIIYGALRPERAPPLPREFGPKTAGGMIVLVLKGLLPVSALIGLVLGSILAGWATATEAAAVGVAGAFVLAILNRRLTLRGLHDMLVRSAITNAMVFFVFIGATAFSYVFRSLGGDHVVTDLVNMAGFGAWGVLILVMVIVFVLGFFFDWVEIVLIVLPVFTPIVKLLDFGDHVAKADMIYWFALLLAVNLQTSFLTPPFGGTLFYLRGVAPPGVTLGHIYRGIVPYVALQLIGLSLTIAFPGIALWLPRYLGG